MRDIHRNLCLLGRALNFPVQDGLCRGLTMVWLEESLLDRNRGYFHRLMNFIASDNPDLLLRRILDAEQKQDQRLFLDTNEETALKIRSFYRRLMHYQRPSFYFTNVISQESISAISAFSAPDPIREQGGFRIVYSEPGLYTQRELTEYYKSLETILHHSSTPPLTEFLISGENHSVGLTYDPIQQWQGMDANQYSCDQSPIKPAEYINRALRIIQHYPFNSPYIGMNTSLLLSEKIAQQADDFIARLNRFKQNRLERPATRLQALRISNFNGYMLAHLGAHFGQVDVLDRIAGLGANLDRPLHNTKTPVFIAAQLGQTEAFECLQRHGANLNFPTYTSSESLRHFALSFHDARVFQRANSLIKKHKSQNQDDSSIPCTPYDIAWILGHKGILNKINNPAGFFFREKEPSSFQKTKDNSKICANSKNRP